MTTSGKELFIGLTPRAFRKLLSIYVFSCFPFGFEGRMWNLIVSVPDYCLSFYFRTLNDILEEMFWLFHLPKPHILCCQITFCVPYLKHPGTWQPSGISSVLCWFLCHTSRLPVCPPGLLIPRWSRYHQLSSQNLALHSPPSLTHCSPELCQIEIKFSLLNVFISSKYITTLT